MNHLKQIAEKLPEYGLDAMLITSEPGERYAIGFHGEGLLLVTREEAHYTTDGRYIEAAQEQIQGADVKLITPDSGHLAQARAFLEERGLHNVGFESGSVTVNVAVSFALSASIAPPCSSTICFAIASPSPAPPRELRAASSR